MDTKERIKNTFSEVGAMNGTNGTEMTNKSNEIMDKLVNDGEIKEMKASKKRVSKKIEATETTSSSSSGAFSGPAIWAKDEKNWRGAAKPIYKGSYRDWETDRKSTRLNSSHSGESRMPSSA